MKTELSFGLQPSFTPACTIAQGYTHTGYASPRAPCFNARLVRQHCLVPGGAMLALGRALGPPRTLCAPGPPRRWVATTVGLLVMSLLGEWLCIRKEMREIPLSEWATSHTLRCSSGSTRGVERSPKAHAQDSRLAVQQWTEVAGPCCASGQSASQPAWSVSRQP